MPIYKDRRSSVDSASSRSLLHEDGKDVGLPRYSSGRDLARHLTWSIPAHMLLIALYTVIFFATHQWLSNQDCHAPQIYTPAQKAISYKKVTFHGDLDETNPYKGLPRPELDAAWHELLQYSNIRISEDTLTKMSRNSVKLADGSGEYLGGLNVHHHLHCLKYIRHYVYKDYYKDSSEFNESNHEEHIDHCLDDLRQTVMCHADTSIYTYDWISDYRKPWPNFKVDHECVNWELLDGWAGLHSFSVFDQKSLVHPRLGLSFPLVNGTIETAALGEGVHFVHPQHKDPD